MPNKIYRDRLINLIDCAVREVENAAVVEHPGLVGRIRELSASNIFGPQLPSGFEIRTGKICDRKGNQSDETDIIIYNRSILPPVLYSEYDGVFPIEACYYSIEVKSKASASAIRDAIRKGKKLLSLDYASADAYKPQNVSMVVLTFFAFGSDLADSGISELQRYAKYDPDWQEKPILKAICVVGKGYWYHSLKDGCWLYLPATPIHDEVINLVSGIGNTLIQHRLEMREAVLGQYLMLERDATPVKSQMAAQPGVAPDSR